MCRRRHLPFVASLIAAFLIAVACDVSSAVAAQKEAPRKAAPAAKAKSAAKGAKTPAQSGAAKPLDLRYVSERPLTAWVLHPQQLLAAPSLRSLPIEVAEALLKQEMGIDIFSVEELIVLVTLNLPQPPLPAVIVRFNKPCDQEAIATRLGQGAGQMIGKLPSHRVKDAAGLALVFPDERTMLVGSSEELAEMLAAKNASSPLIDHLKKIDGNESLSGVLVVDPIRPVVKAMLAQLGPLPPEFQQFTEAADLLSAAELHLRFGEAADASLVLEGASQGAAAKLNQLLENAIALGTAAVDAQLAQAAANDPGPVNEAMGRYVRRTLKSAIDAIDRNQNRNRLTLRVQGGSDTSVGLATNGVLVALLLPAVQSAREAARRAQSNNNLKQIGLAMQNYADVHRHFPPRAIFADGKPLLSWRVAILPMIEQKALYDQFHLDEPWDSDHNRQLIEKMPVVYANPSVDANRTRAGQTTYLAPTGKGTMFDGEKYAGFATIKDGTSNTLMVVESNADRAVIWTRPDDLDVETDNPHAGLGGIHPGGFLAVFADGHTSFIKNSIDAAMLLRLFNPNDGLPVDID